MLCYAARGTIAACAPTSQSSCTFYRGRLVGCKFSGRALARVLTRSPAPPFFEVLRQDSGNHLVATAVAIALAIAMNTSLAIALATASANAFAIASTKAMAIQFTSLAYWPFLLGVLGSAASVGSLVFLLSLPHSLKKAT